MGDEAGEPKGGFIVVDQDFKVKGAWSEDHSPFGCVVPLLSSSAAVH